ncbi:3-oxoacyl-[acyl-carrier-protein] reductase FabG [mine drainage metagenome]|uniref:3-oxoacyl-[acyl-carrier-protein] reductase FabG n=1 Tax=mine drainage metagenome TaxID=410659 RepID=A0A1J5QQL6_9ZZZZ
MNISGRRILITGAAGGIGSELVMALAEKGAELVLVDIDANKLGQLKLAIRERGGRVQVFPCDLAAPESLQRLIRQVGDEAGPVDVLINCAGIASFGLFEQQPVEGMELLWRINVLVPMQLTRALLPQMKARGHGRIVNVGSVFGSIGFAYFTSYSASKFALRGFSEALRRELEGSGVGVTYVAPRYTRTPLNDGAVSRMARAVGMNSDEPAVVAWHAVRAIAQEREDCYIGWPECLFVRINALLPRLVDFALRKQNALARPFAIQEAE